MKEVQVDLAILLDVDQRMLNSGFHNVQSLSMIKLKV